jgi:aquaporin Z
MQYAYIRYLYEFIGTFFLVFTVGMLAFSTPAAALFAPLAIGSILAVMVYAGGHVSGGHYNPAVSLAVFLRGKLSQTDLWAYWIAQLVAAIIAAYFVIYFKGTVILEPLQLPLIKGFLAEFLFSFALCYVVLNTATAHASQGNSFYGFAIGFTVLAGAYAVGSISGAAFNSAVALGITILNLVTLGDLWIFIVANLLGGACAALIFNMAHDEQMRLMPIPTQKNADGVGEGEIKIEKK